MHHLTTTPGLFALGGLAAWFAGCLFFAASGITHYRESRRKIRAARRNP
ncbi:hypothetical protein ACH4UM_18805 [Streptomyces sp. NPDC020801]